MSIAEERQNRIVELINERDNIQVEHLTGILDMNRMMIQRDLDKLKQEGIVERRHGATVTKHEATRTGKMVTMMEEKQQLASTYAAVVKLGDTVFLDPGTTICKIAKRVVGTPDLTVITNDIEVGSLLHRSNMELMICGGMVRKEAGSIFGTFSNQMMSYIHVGITFTGAMSIDSNLSIPTPTMDRASLKCMVTENANRGYLVVDHSKFNQQALMKINNLQDYTGMVTIKVFDEEELERTQKRDIYLIMVGDGTEQAAA